VPLRALLFDLDHTLFDTERTERRALRSVASAIDVRLGGAGIVAYQQINTHVWAEYRAGRLTSKEMRVLRFERWLKHLDRASHDPRRIAKLYLETFSSHGDLIAGAAAALRSTSALGHRLGVVTNGIDRVQRRRLAASGLAPHFRTVVTSERVGITKPDPRIIELALRRLRVSPDEALYVGDDPSIDGRAAHDAGVKFVWFNPRGNTRPDHLDAERTTVIARLADIAALARNARP